MCNFILGCVCTSALTVIIIIKWKEYLCICYLQDLGNSAPDGLAYIVLSSGSITRGVLSNIKLSAPTYITSSWMYVYICVILYYYTREPHAISHYKLKVGGTY